MADPARTHAAHNEIAIRYAWLGRQQRYGRSSPKLIARVRMREIERLFAYRWGVHLPDDDAGIDDLELAAHHIAGLDGDAEKHILAWAREWAPWLWERTEINPEAFAARIAANPRRYRADTLAWRLGLTKVDRDRLGITTIGAVDCNAAMRANARRERSRHASTARRRAAGSKTRADYEAGSLSSSKPWAELGMSRSTWYAKGKPMPSDSADDLRTSANTADGVSSNGASGLVQPRTRGARKEGLASKKIEELRDERGTTEATCRSSTGTAARAGLPAAGGVRSEQYQSNETLAGHEDVAVQLVSKGKTGPGRRMTAPEFPLPAISDRQAALTWLIPQLGGGRVASEIGRSRFDWLHRQLMTGRLYPSALRAASRDCTGAAA